MSLIERVAYTGIPVSTVLHRCQEKGDNPIDSRKNRAEGEINNVPGIDIAASSHSTRSQSPRFSAEAQQTVSVGQVAVEV